MYSASLGDAVRDISKFGESVKASRLRHFVGARQEDVKQNHLKRKDANSVTTEIVRETKVSKGGEKAQKERTEKVAISRGEEK